MTIFDCVNLQFVRPLYRTLLQSQCGKDLARDVFLRHRGNYHPIAQKMVANDLGIDEFDAPKDLEDLEDAEQHGTSTMSLLKHLARRNGTWLVIGILSGLIYAAISRRRRN